MCKGPGPEKGVRYGRNPKTLRGTRKSELRRVTRLEGQQRELHMTLRPLLHHKRNKLKRNVINIILTPRDAQARPLRWDLSSRVVYL